MKTPNDLGERLRSLPQFTPPSGGWAELERKLELSRQRRRQRTTLFALAASVVLTLGTVATLPIFRAPAHIDAATITPTQSPEVRSLMAQSRALESNLQQSRSEVAVWDAASAARAAALQRDLTIVDLQLSYASPQGAQRLWRDRVNLLSSLLRTHEEAGLVNTSYVARAENKL